MEKRRHGDTEKRRNGEAVTQNKNANRFLRITLYASRITLYALRSTLNAQLATHFSKSPILPSNRSNPASRITLQMAIK
jgi:hypothetical protein